MKFTRLLGFKLFLIIFIVLMGVTILFTTLTTNWHSRQYLGKTVKSVMLLSDVVKRSLHYSMLLNRREDIAQIITTVGGEEGIEVVRVYNKDGMIAFSSNREELETIVDLNDVACRACHPAGKAAVAPRPDDLTRIFESSEGHRVVGAITPIYNEQSCATAECHAHPESQTVLGVLDIIVPLHDLDESLAELRAVHSIGAVVMVLVVTALSGIFIWVMVNIPVRNLTRGTEEVRKGNLNHRISVRSNDEIGALASSFNHMADELQKARRELTDWARHLERRVEEKTEALRRAQAQMIHMEKMASLGTLAATVAHELNNPLEGVLTYAKLLKRKVDASAIDPDTRAEVLNELSIIAKETARCGNIVKNLLLFSRQKVGEFKTAELCEIIEQTFKLIEHHLKINDITLEFKRESCPIELVCDAGQIEQALLAIEINAVEAMPDGGTLRVEVQREKGSDHVKVIISDTGSGIRPEDLPHIFEPFYTTKQEGKGTGLGLAVSYGIVERHGGSINVESQPGRGSTFTLTLPLHANVEQQSSKNNPIHQERDSYGKHTTTTA